mmetsp:Transcript_13559/g.36688  ORF Transcript_13559/g.36688 Transcript_13559/m.36688 type:complete len:690 (-) Transcript_13559:688-2757(-)
MLPFVLGTASVLSPPQIGLPIAVGSLGIKGVQNAIKNRRRCTMNTSVSGSPHGWAELNKGLPKDEQICLEWNNITCTLNDKHHNNRKLLEGVSGQAKPGRLIALMGPSGSGKTTLLNALAGQVPCSSSLELSGSVTVNGMPSSESTHRQAYVQQDDVFYTQLTVAETLNMAAELRLPPSMTPAQKKEYVDQLMKVLGLNKVANTVVGDAKKRGLSGGEKKRLSLGCELVGSPPLIFLDEPTTGLDAPGAEKVMRTLHSLAASGQTVVASIHQPRSSIWSMFDDLVLLHEGKVVYSGPAGEEALEHFAQLGYPCPPHHNPAEFVADLVSPESNLEGKAGEAQVSGRERVDRLVEAWRQKGQHKAPVTSTSKQAVAPSGDRGKASTDEARPNISWWRQFKLLAHRSWRQATRDKAAAMARIGSNLSSALIFGCIFNRMGRSQSSIQDRLGLLQVAAINTAMSSLIKTLNVFPRERLIVNRERAKHSYTTAPYLAAKLLAELPLGAVFPLLFGAVVYPLTGLNPNPKRFLSFLGVITLESFASSALGLSIGAAAPSTESAVALGPAVMLVFIVFGGYYVNADNVPRVLKVLPKTSLIKQAFEALVVNEFRGTTFEPDAEGKGMTDGQQVLSWLSFGDTSIRTKLSSQARILAFFYVTTFAILSANKPKFQPLNPPKDPEVEVVEEDSKPRAA